MWENQAQIHALQSANYHKHAFTLAEVLITLGIIGVVAAMTMPTLMGAYRKRVAETRLAKFYSVMSQAIKRAEVDHGDIAMWDKWQQLYEKDAEGNDDKSKRIADAAFFNKYIKPYIKATKIEENEAGKHTVYFSDGSLASIGPNSVQFWPRAKDFRGYDRDEETNAIKNRAEDSGTKYFTFMLIQTPLEIYNNHMGFFTYKLHWDGTRETLLNHSSLGCNKDATNEKAYCAALIEMNGWKIPDDYPLQF